MTEFQHSEKFIYSTSKHINLIQPTEDITRPKLLRKLPINLIPKNYEFINFTDDTAIGYKNDKLFFICRRKRGGTNFTVMKYNSCLKLLGRYDVFTHRPTSALKLLNIELNGVNFNYQSAFNKYQNDLPHNIRMSRFIYPISGMCYDQYEDTIVLTVADEKDDNMNCGTIEVWQKTDKWTMIRKSIKLNIEQDIKNAEGMTNLMDSMVIHLECSRNHIILELNIGDLACVYHHVVLLDKFTFELVYWLPGVNPTFYDDYDRWQKGALKMLIHLPFSHPLLKIILSYVS
jgi:hypothetical protein